MLYNKIIELVSKHLADELVSESEMLSYMDRVIDDINNQMSTSFPTFTEFKEDNISIPATELDYNIFPDKYIRTVVVPGAAFKYYTTDEEGGYASPKYEEDYRQGLFYMLRDYSFSVPEKYRLDNQGYINMNIVDDTDIVDFRGGLF